MKHLCLNCKFVGDNKEFSSLAHLSYFHCPNCPKRKNSNILPLDKVVDFYNEVKNLYGNNEIDFDFEILESCASEFNPRFN